MTVQDKLSEDFNRIVDTLRITLDNEATSQVVDRHRVPLVGLSPWALRRAERDLARKAKLRKARKKYTRKPGTVHPKKKQATRRRRMERRWASDPFWCVVYGYGAHSLDRELWDRHIAPLWKLYNPRDLSVRKYRGYGTKAKPYTVYTIDVIHAAKGVVYKGQDQELYDLSCPKA
jgi:hypothetical protein